MLQSIFIYAGLLPFITAAVITFALAWLQVSPRAIWAWAVAGGFVVGLVGLKSEEGMGVAIRAFTQPQEAAYWLPILVLLSLGVSLLLMATPQAGRLFAVALAVFVTIAATQRLLGSYAGFHHNHWTVVGKLGCLALFAGTLGILWTFLASKGNPARSLPERQPLLVIVTVGTAVVLTLSGVLVYGSYCGAIAASLTGVALACSVLNAIGYTSAPTASTPEPLQASSGVSGAAGVLTFSLGGLIVLAYFFASLTATNLTLLLISLAAAGTAFPSVFSNGPTWRRLATRTVLCLVPLAIAVLSVAAKQSASPY